MALPRPLQAVPLPQPRDTTLPFAGVADSFKTDTWRVGLGAGWRS